MSYYVATAAYMRKDGYIFSAYKNEGCIAVLVLSHLRILRENVTKKENEAILINGKGKMENTSPFCECFNA